MVFEPAELHAESASGEGIAYALLDEVVNVEGGGSCYGEVDADGGGGGVAGVEVWGWGRLAAIPSTKGSRRTPREHPRRRGR